MTFKTFAAMAVLAFAAACAPPAPPAATDQAATPAPITPVAVTAPAGTYTLDKTHASLTFQVNHMGLSNYTARFTDFDATLTLDPANLTASTVTARINPASVRTDYPGNYRGTHTGTPYRSWDDDLARNPQWFNTAAFPEITFQSTGITLTGERTGTMTGDLTFLGQTHPVTLDVTFNGERNPHPMMPTIAAVGFSARGTLNRSTWGMGAYIPQAEGAPGISDAVNLIIEAEFQAPLPAPAAPAAATPAQ